MPNENQLYEQWHSAPQAVKKTLEDQLYSVVRKHVAAILALRFPDADPHLARDIAADILRHLETFERKSQFSTWVHSFTINKIKQEFRRRARYRRVIDDTITLEDVDAKKRWRGNQKWNPSIDLDQVRQGLTRDESTLFDLKREGFTIKEIARMLNKNPHAIESAVRRLISKLLRKSTHQATEK